MVRHPPNILAWQGWTLTLPPRWNPVKIEGDYEGGGVLLADLLGPRLGVRWQKPGRRFEAQAWAMSSMKQEVGALAAQEARLLPLRDDLAASHLYIDPEPPGRDVWVAQSTVSGRALQLVYRSRRREHALSGVILPTLMDNPPDQPVPWSIFGLSCITPAGLRLVRHQLNAGDLMLSFAGSGHELTLRQVALARQALARMPMEKWIGQLTWPRRLHYRSAVDGEAVELPIGRRRVKGLVVISARRRRFFWAWRVPQAMFTYGLDDPARDRLVFAQSDDADLAQAVIRTVGWSGEDPEGTNAATAPPKD